MHALLRRAYFTVNVYQFYPCPCTWQHLTTHPQLVPSAKGQFTILLFPIVLFRLLANHPHFLSSSQVPHRIQYLLALCVLEAEYAPVLKPNKLLSSWLPPWAPWSSPPPFLTHTAKSLHLHASISTPYCWISILVSKHKPYRTTPLLNTIFS